jgi:hypothetical protein
MEILAAQGATTVVVDNGGKEKKYSIRKVLIIYFRHLLNFFLQVHFKVRAVEYCSNYWPPGFNHTSGTAVAKLLSIITLSIWFLLSWDNTFIA